MSLMKVVWYVLRVKNMLLWSPSDPSRTAATEAKPSYIYSILKQHGQNFRNPVRPLLSEAKPSYVYSILKPHGQSSKSHVRLLLSDAKLSYIHTILKKHYLLSRSQAVVGISTPRLYPRSGYLLVNTD